MIREAEAKENIPWGYELVCEQDMEVEGKNRTVQLYRNINALPLMYAYSGYVLEDEYDQLKPYEKEQAMMQGIVLEDQSDIGDTDIQPAEGRGVKVRRPLKAVAGQTESHQPPHA